MPSAHSYLPNVATPKSGGVTGLDLRPHAGIDGDGATKFVRLISEVGVISDNGRTAHLGIDEANQEKPANQMTYTWLTWLLDQPKKTADGPRPPDNFER